jgi:hypothetical protein
MVVPSKAAKIADPAPQPKAAAATSRSAIAPASGSSMTCETTLAVNTSPRPVALTPLAGGVELNSTVLRVLVPGFHLDIPRTSVRSATRSALRTRSIGVHGGHGRWLVNGSYNGLNHLRFDHCRSIRGT